MWSVSHLCRCTSSLRAARSKVLLPSRSGFSISYGVSRQLVTPTKCSNSTKYRLSNILKSNSLVIRFCSTTPKQKTPKAVGYWLLGCSGMVFTAVVLEVREPVPQTVNDSECRVLPFLALSLKPSEINEGQAHSPYNIIKKM